MPAVLALAVAGALAFIASKSTTLAPAHPDRRADGIAADGWIGRYDLPTIPATWPSRNHQFGPVLELPFNEGTSTPGDVSHHAARHQTVNGQSGISRRTIGVQLAFGEGDATASMHSHRPIPSSSAERGRGS